MKKNVLIIIAASLLIAGCGTHKAAMPIDEKINYIMDCVDETDFWELCDSAAFAQYAENSDEWCDAVIMQYKEMYNLK